MIFDKILIANRGEIACRVIKTARRLGINTVAVYSEADAAARHVALADEAIEIGPAPAIDSYLRSDRIIDAAERSGADAIHPGYGLLSENADFAAACAAAGIVFVGPPADAIRSLGSKSAAKALMQRAGVPLIDGYAGDAQDAATLAAEAQRIGYPVLLKPSAGGGGRGMRIVARASDFETALAGARRESEAAFGDQRMLLEKFLARPRHIEVQVFADTHGHCVHLFERDCSVQRRHQKVIEEAPAPGFDEARRAPLTAAAIDAARAVGYVGAGTVEFLVDEDGSFYFIEMNTRLQVEHPVTESITSLDLVEWQLRVAAGETLPLTQDQLAMSGHAIEARIYAEDPERDFVPATGHLLHLRFPADDRHLRVDTGVRAGDAVSVHYDPMIAKLVVRDRDRDAARRRLQLALRDTQIVGVLTNLDFLAGVLEHPAFVDGRFDTGLIDREREAVPGTATRPTGMVLALAALDRMLAGAAEARRSASSSSDPYSPWHRTDGWRANADSFHVLHFVENGAPREVIVHYRDDHFLIDTDDGRCRATAYRDEAGDLVATLDGRRSRATCVRDGDELILLYRGRRFTLGIVDALAGGAADRQASGALTAPMPGKIVAVHVRPGETVAPGQPVIVIEAMKMEHTITAPFAGTVAGVNYRVGELIDEGVELLVLGPQTTE